MGGGGACVDVNFQGKKVVNGLHPVVQAQITEFAYSTDRTARKRREFHSVSGIGYII